MAGEEKKKDPMDAALDKEVMKDNLHRVMLDNLDIVGKFLQIRTEVFMQACWNQGVLNKSQSEHLLQVMIHAKIIQVAPMLK